jgi:hypothetical protein
MTELSARPAENGTARRDRETPNDDRPAAAPTTALAAAGVSIPASPTSRSRRGTAADNAGHPPESDSRERESPARDSRRPIESAAGESRSPRPDARDNWFPAPDSGIERAVNLSSYALQGTGLFLRWKDAGGAAAGPVYGTGMAAGGILGLKAGGEEVYVLFKGGTPNYRRMAAGLSEAAFAGAYGWYNAMGRNPAAGGFSSTLQGAFGWYRAGQAPGQVPPSDRGPILPLHNRPPVRQLPTGDQFRSAASSRFSSAASIRSVAGPMSERRPPSSPVIRPPGHSPSPTPSRASGTAPGQSR